MIKILSEPVGEDYKIFIDFATLECATFSLVWKYEFVLDETTKIVHELLKGHQISEEIVRNKYLEDRNKAFPVLRKFLLDHESKRVLKDSPFMFACPKRESKVSWRINEKRQPGLFSWVSPCLPEDLVFYSKDGIVWLESVSHEEEFYMYDNEAVENLMQHLPSLKKV